VFATSVPNSEGLAKLLSVGRSSQALQTKSISEQLTAEPFKPRTKCRDFDIESKRRQLSEGSLPEGGEFSCCIYRFDIRTRHSTAIDLLRSGVDVSTIAHWLDHGHVNTANKYLSIGSDAKREAPPPAYE
jgi:hypothetical protein